jgi:phenylacetate-coenzyme A ligase PaaK-like adenylate-forming protein
MAQVIATGGHTAANSRFKSGNTSDKPNVGKWKIFSVHQPLAELVSQLNHYQPTILQGYASTILLLANEQEAGRLHISPLLVLPSSEGLTDREYYKVTGAFRTKVITFYGSTESGFVAQGCRYHWLHLASDWAIVEPVDADFQPVAPGVQSHTVLVSNLTNYVQPILRYDIGDSILMRPDRCPCGNPMPAFQVLGRVADILKFPAQDGTAVKITSLQLSTLFDSIPEVQLSQVIQTDDTTLRVRLLIAKEANQDQVWQKVQSEMGNLLKSHKLEHVLVVQATEPPEQAMGGKYREVIPLNR